MEVLSVSNGSDYSVYKCPNGNASCPPGPLGKCGGGAIGLMCERCPREPAWSYWHRGEGRCVPCSRTEDGGSVWVLPISIVVLLIMMCVVYRHALPAPGRQQLPRAMEVAIPLAQLLVLVQMGTVLGDMDIPWGHPIEDILRVLKAFVLDLEFLKLDCAAGLSYAERFVVGSTVPLMIIILYAATSLLMLRLLKIREACLRGLNASGLGLHCFFVGLTFHGVEPFLGFQHPNGKWSMRSGPDVIFGEPAHQGLMACSVLHLTVYCPGATYQRNSDFSGLSGPTFEPPKLP